MQWQPFRFRNAAYDLSHLHPIAVTYQQPAKGDRPTRCYSVEVSFGLHCFTRSAAPDEGRDPALLYSDSRETRVFDFRRYELSKQLPAIVRDLSRRKCYHSGKGNFFTVVSLDDQGRRIEYDVFFEASRSAKRGVVRLFVQSAYVRDAQHSSRPRLKPIGIYVILHNTLHKIPIKIQQ